VAPLGGPFNAAAAAAMRDTFGVEPAFTREGGSIGAVLTMRRLLDVPIVFLGLSLPEHGYHAINENFDWAQASGGMELFCRYFHAIGALGRPGRASGGGAAATRAKAKAKPKAKAKAR
jgi:acetylornithine deacetylase/succinyl-diaminopimelate desuccinylase-like protein